MIIPNLSSYGNSKAPEILAHAQTISNFFLDALEQNDCNLKIVVGFYFEIDDSINTATDIANALTPEIPTVKNKKPTGTYSDTPSVILRTPDGIDQAVQALKQKCFDCKLSLPKIKFEKDFRFSYNKLSLQLDIYKQAFPKLQRPRLINYCHVSFGLQKACIPDILKVIAMLLSAFSAIMALNKLPKITLGAFVKVIIGKLIMSVVANIKLSVDMSQTGLPCILSAIEEIARAIPTKQQVYDLPMSDFVRDQLFPKEPYTTISGKVKQPFVPESVFMQSQNAKLKSKEITKEEYDKNVAEYQKRNSPALYYSKQLRQQTELLENRAEEKVSEAFGKVSDVLTKAQDDVNAYIQSLLGVLDYFECESARSGPDFSELIEYINNLQEVINFFSSVMSIWIKKMFEPLLCMEAITHKDIKNIINTTQLPPLSNTDLADIIQDFTGSVTKVSADGNSILIYNKPAKPLLPKLTLIGCNLKEFAEAHTIDNIINAVIDEASKTKTDIVDTDDNIFRPVTDITKGLPNIPISVPKSNYYAPIPITIPLGVGRINLPKIPTPITDIFRTGTKLALPTSLIDVIKNIPKGNNPNKPTDKVLPPTIPLPTIPVVKDIIDKIKDTKDKTNDIVNRIPIPTKPTLPSDIEDEIDDILDFIYNPPKPSDTSDIDDYITPTDIGIDPNTEDYINSISMSKETSRSSLKQHSSQQECKTFEDVLDILGSLKI